MQLDHLVITAPDLEAGGEFVMTELGVTPSAGGRHAAMGTWNRLVSLGAGVYLEVIATDPGAPSPGRPRWFGLDARPGAPRLSHWVLRGDDIDAALAAAPPGTGVPMDLQRGDLRWRMAVTPAGRLPFDDIFPALIEWAPGPHPAAMLPDAGLRLARLEIAHPEAAALSAALAALPGGLADPRIAFVTAPTPGLCAHIDTPRGRKFLQ